MHHLVSSAIIGVLCDGGWGQSLASNASCRSGFVYQFVMESRWVSCDSPLLYVLAESGPLIPAVRMGRPFLKGHWRAQMVLNWEANHWSTMTSWTVINLLRGEKPWRTTKVAQRTDLGFHENREKLDGKDPNDEVLKNTLHLKKKNLCQK